MKRLCSYCGKVLTDKHTFSCGVKQVFACSHPACQLSRKNASLKLSCTRTKIEIKRMFELLKQQRDECEDNYARAITNLYARALAWVLKDPQVESLLLPEKSKSLYESDS
ncbi:MAG: hypothetical protein V3V68_05020 [Nitrosomonadaceae bacterium]